MAGVGKVSAGKAGAVKEGPSPVPQTGCWTLGLINSEFKYLSAESFGFHVSCCGKTMTKKQMWLLEPNDDGASVFLKSHLDKYLAVDQFGYVTCENDAKDDTAKFEISVSDDSSGRWAFRSVNRGDYLGGTQDKLVCSAKTPGSAELWHVHLVIRPQMNIRSKGRRRFAALEEDEVQVEQNVAWGEKTLFTLEWREEAYKYAVKADNKYLGRDGKVVDRVTEDCLFAVEYYGGYLALKDQQGMYMSPIGAKAVMKSRSKVVTTDELFSLEKPIPQVSIQAVGSGKYVSVKQGLDVAANQAEVGEDSKFLLEKSETDNGWNLRTVKDKYLSLGPGGVVQDLWPCSTSGLIQLEWLSGGGVRLKASNGLYISTKKGGGQLVANNDTENKFYLHMINRPNIILRCDQGYVGVKSSTSATLVCNKPIHEVISVEKGESGAVHLRGQSGKYWVVSAGGLVVDGEDPQDFYLELKEQTKVCIKTADGLYVNSENGGAVKMVEVKEDLATTWEF